MAKSFLENRFRGIHVTVSGTLARIASLSLALPAVALAASGASSEGTDHAALQLELRRVFAPETLPAALRVYDTAPMKSATLLVRAYDAARESMPLEDVRAVDGWLERSGAQEVLETEHFRLRYTLDGEDAVPPEDTAPADGVPDFVARAAAYAETAWQALFHEAGFATPRLVAGRVEISFQEMAAFGYTRVRAGAAELVLHRNFEDFPANDDPDGDVAGAAKVTAAHELKHASQYAASGWTEGGWLEADAVWAEDFVFDSCNDYLRFLTDDSPVSDPADWRPISYGDCLFPRLLAESHGSAVLVDFFTRRAARRDEPVEASFDAVLRARGSSLAEAAATLGLWSWFCGANAAGRPVGFEEADLYPTPPAAATIDVSRDGSLAGLGTQRLYAFAADRTGRPRITFAGDRSAPFGLWAITLDREGRRAVERIPLSAGNTGASELGRDWDELVTLILVVTNGSAAGDAGYGVSLDGDAAVGVSELAGAAAFSLHPNRPNPFRNATTLSFSLAQDAPVSITVHDAAGRVVRRLLDGATLAAGTHERIWDGRDSRGRAAAPGMYAVQVRAGALTSTRKILLVR